jgi:hypothetical protein
MNRIYLSGRHTSTRISSRLAVLLTENHPSAVGMATAFLSVWGARAYDDMLKKNGVRVSRVVAGLAGEVTHPEAIGFLRGAGHVVRFGEVTGGIFHPKLLVGGDRFLNSGQLAVANCAYIGSANFTSGGMARNLEVILATKEPGLAIAIARAFRSIWNHATPVTSTLLTAYERAFARVQRRRSLADLELLDVVEPDSAVKPGQPTPIVPPRLGSAVWAGLESFTGEHAFQVEFPRTAGEALRALLKTASGKVPIECVDGETRIMTFRYYEDNGMYRLNVPNNMPLVDWARTNKNGALLVWRDDLSPEQTLHAEIIRGRRLTEVEARSTALRTWGKTQTRSYGWY